MKKYFHRTIKKIALSQISSLFGDTSVQCRNLEVKPQYLRRICGIMEDLQVPFKVQ